MFRSSSEMVELLIITNDNKSNDHLYSSSFYLIGVFLNERTMLFHSRSESKLICSLLNPFFLQKQTKIFSLDCYFIIAKVLTNFNGT